MTADTKPSGRSRVALENCTGVWIHDCPDVGLLMIETEL